MKIARHKKILELIRDNEVTTQEELASLLIDSNYIVTQATVSRDIRELGLTKMSINGSTSKYVTDFRIDIGSNYIQRKDYKEKINLYASGTFGLRTCKRYPGEQCNDAVVCEGNYTGTFIRIILCDVQPDFQTCNETRLWWNHYYFLQSCICSCNGSSNDGLGCSV